MSGGFNHPGAAVGNVSPADIFTTLKNAVTALNGVAQTLAAINGITNAAGIAATTVVKPSNGRVATVSITTAGSAPGVIYDASNASDTTRPLYAIPNTIGVVHLNMPAQYGIVVAPGTGQVICVAYS